MHRIPIALVVALLSIDALAASPLQRSESVDPQVPSPAAILGFELGSRPARYHEIARYFEALAAASPTATLLRHGRSHEGRDLIHLIITSSDNQARLEQIKSSIHAIAQAPASQTSAIDAVIANTPAVVYLAYSIHGDELSGADAALAVAYELAAGRDDATRRLRDELVVIIDPTENPDGRERFLSMTAAYSGVVANPDPESLAHTAFWPWGRTNHYLFDLNRDWFALVHPESQARVNILREWRPQLVVDAHEMGGQSTFLFNPPRHPFNPNLPSSTEPWWQRFGADQASAFDRHGWSYYAGEWNEEFFPGYGSSLALYYGAIAILYEQAGTEGGPLRKDYGGTLTYVQSVEHQFVSSFANLDTAARARIELLQKFRSSRVEAMARGAEGPVRAYYFAATPHPARAAHLANRLAMLGCVVERTTGGGKLTRAHDLYGDGRTDVTLPAGSYRIRLDQPDGLLARAILEPHTPMADAALAEEREYLERQKGSRIYDTTAWSPLLAYGLAAFWSEQLDGLGWESVTTVASPVGSAPVWSPQTPDAGYGLVWDGSTDGAVVLAARLASSGGVVRVAERPFTVAETTYPRGSFLLRSEENRDTEIATKIAASARQLGVDVVAARSGRPTSGPDLGGGYFELLTASRIGILAGDPLSTYSVGAAWHLVDKEFGLRVSLVDVANVGSVDLNRYNVLVLPDGGAGDGYRRALGANGIDALREWVRDGGTLVAIGAAALAVADPEVKLSETRARAAVLEDFPSPRFGLSDAAIRSLERLQATGLGNDGKAVQSAGLYAETSWPAELSIPGVGSPILGPGTWDLLGKVGDAARERKFPPASLPAEKKTETKGDKPKSDKVATAEPSGEKSKDEQKKDKERADQRLRRFNPSGALLRADLDLEHWLSYGAGDRVAVLVRGRDSLIARDPVQTVGRYGAIPDLHLGGLLWPEAAGRIAQTAFLTRESLGRGQLILFADDPNFRGYFWGDTTTVPQRCVARTRPRDQAHRAMVSGRVSQVSLNRPVPVEGEEGDRVRHR